MPLRRYDQWVTREPDWYNRWLDEPVQPKCAVCGKFVKDVVLHRLFIEEGDWCDGKQIIIDGEEMGTLCGVWRDHEPHFNVQAGYTVIYRQCQGHVTKELVF